MLPATGGSKASLPKAGSAPGFAKSRSKPEGAVELTVDDAELMTDEEFNDYSSKLYTYLQVSLSALAEHYHYS